MLDLTIPIYIRIRTLTFPKDFVFPYPFKIAYASDVFHFCLLYLLYLGGFQHPTL